MELMIFAWLIAAYIVKNGVVDAAYAVRGRPSPRQQAQERRWGAATAAVKGLAGRKTRPRRRHPAREYFKGLYDDSWQRAAEKRRIRHEVRDPRKADEYRARLEAREARRQRRRKRSSSADDEHPQPQHGSGDRNEADSKPGPMLGPPDTPEAIPTADRADPADDGPNAPAGDAPIPVGAREYEWRWTMAFARALTARSDREYAKEFATWFANRHSRTARADLHQAVDEEEAAFREQWEQNRNEHTDRGQCEERGCGKPAVVQQTWQHRWWKSLSEPVPLCGDHARAWRTAPGATDYELVGETFVDPNASTPPASNGTEVPAPRTPEKEGTASMPNGETTTLSATLASLQEWEASATEAITSLEQSIASLQAAEVGPGVTGPLANAQESYSAAVAAFSAARDALEGSVQIGDLYAADPDAGDKEFVRS